MLFLSITKGSAGAARSQLYRSKDSGYLADPEFNELLQLVTAFSSQTQHLIEYLNRSAHKGTRNKAEERADLLNENTSFNLPF
jgi:hypothetical protein